MLNIQHEFESYTETAVAKILVTNKVNEIQTCPVGNMAT